MADFKDIRASLKKLVEDNSTLIQSVYNYERFTFDGFPSLVIVPSDNSADYSSTQKDKVTFVFNLRIFYPVKNETESSEAEAALEAVVDELLTLLRNRGVITTCDWVEPTPSTWTYEARGEAVYRVAEIKVKCIKYLDHNS